MGFGIKMVFAASMLIVTSMPILAETPPEDAFQGVWQLSGGEVDGKALSEMQISGGKLEINGTGYTFTLAPVGTIVGTQKLGAMRQVNTIDITDETGPHKGQTCLGIYELDGNEFRVVFAPPGGQRPVKFATVPESGQWLHVWKRIQE